MILESIYADKNGQTVMLGDVLSSQSTHDVVVMWDEEANDFAVVVLPDMDIKFTLEEFMESWHGLEVTNNMMVIKNK